MPYGMFFIDTLVCMKYLRILVSLIIAHTAGLVGSVFTARSIETWYASLNKPTWNPPNWIFAPVWLMLYSLMGYAAYLIWRVRTTDPRADRALTVYAIHLIVNAGWSVIYFGWRDILFAFYWILMLDVLIIVTLVLFWRIKQLAGVLLIPYLAWALFASYLNYTLLLLN